MKTPIRIATFIAALVLPLVLNAASSGKEAIDSAQPSLTEANITRLTVGLLGHSQFAHQPLDNALAGSFLDRYLDVLDGDHSLFLASDVTEFSALRGTLARDIRRTGDTRAAYAIFKRYLERLEQRTVFITESLRTDSYDFTGQDVYRLDRREAERPRDLAAAHQLWRQRLRLDYLQEKLDDKTPDEIVTVLGKRAERMLQTMSQMTRDTVLELYLSALANVYDPHSDYLGHEQLAEFDIAMNLSLFGIGARLRINDGYCEIIDLLAGGPAATSGQLNPGDRIVGVAQDGAEPVDIVGMPLSYAVQLIRGPKGSVVDLTVLPASAGDDSVRKTIVLVRDEIKLEEQRAKSTIIDMHDQHGEALRLGVVELPSFYAEMGGSRGQQSDDSTPPTSATADVALLLEKLQAEGVQGVILDLRRNGGGSLDEAIDLTGLFIADGPVVQTRGPRGDIDVAEDTDPSVQYDGPLLVLTSRLSASASEILAGALQDYGRAIIVGDPSTYGKGTVQSVLRLAPIMDQNGLLYSHDPGALTVTIRKFYRPSGASTQLKGVVPDIVLPSPSSGSEIGESVLKNPLPWDTVPPAEHDRLAMVAGHLSVLREASARRVASGRDFAYLKAETERLTRRLGDRTVSLNEAVRREEIADFERRKQEYEAAMRLLDASSPITYDVTVRNAGLPGLPSPSSTADSPPVAQTMPVGDGDDEQAADEQTPQRDVVMHEARRILADYLALLRHGAGSTLARTAPPEPPDR